jgi:hypothetical protein
VSGQVTGELAEQRRTEGDAGQDLADDTWLAEAVGDGAQTPGQDEHQRDLADHVCDDGIHA